MFFEPKSRQTTMREEMNLIQAILDAMSIKARVHGEPISFETSKARIYYLWIDASVSPAKVKSQLNESLDHFLTTARGELVHSRIVLSPLRVEVPRPNPVSIPIHEPLAHLGGAYQDSPVMLLGEYWNARYVPLIGERRSPDDLAIDLSDPATPHVLIGAGTGAGKTKLFQSMILSLAVISSPESVRMILIDPKSIHLAHFKLPHLLTNVVLDAEDGGEVLLALLAEMDRRKRLCKENAGSLSSKLAQVIGPYIVCFVDEVPEVVHVGGEAVEIAINRILRFGREVRIHLVLATQQATQAYVSAISDAKVNLPVRIVGKVSQIEHAKDITGVAGREVGAHALNIAEFIAVYGGDMRRFAAYYLQDDWLPDAVAGVWALWRHTLGREPAPPPPFDLKARSTGFGDQVRPRSAPVTLTQPEPPVQSYDHDRLIALLTDMVKTGETVSASVIRSLWQEKTGKGMNGTTAARILEIVRDEVKRERAVA